jgi:tetratricopeptide (TPR) repeat protein
MTRPGPRSFRWLCRTIILLYLAVILPGMPRASGQVPAGPKPSPPLTAQQQERLKERDKLSDQVKTLRDQGKLPEAIKAAEAILQIEREVLGETSEDVIGSLELLGQLHQDREDWAAAKQFRIRVLELRTNGLGKDLWKVTDAEWALGNIDTLAKLNDQDRRRLREADRLSRQADELYGRREWDKPEGLVRQALAIREELLGKHHPDLAESLNNLGFSLKQQGKYGEARAYLQRALEMFQARHPKERYPHGHPNLAFGLSNLGGLLEAQGNYGEAREYLQRALEMEQALYPKERYPHGHPYLAGTLNHLGCLLMDQGTYAEARGYLQRALEMDRALYPKERYPQGHPELALTLNDLGFLL